MTCYMRHMDWLFEALDLTSDKVGRRRVDSAIRDVLGLGDEAHCPEIWSALKSLTDDERAGLPDLIRARLET